MKKTKTPAQPSEKIVSLYNDEVRISYDDINHSYVKALRFPDGTYTDWEPTHGITTPLVMVPKQFLMPWAAKEAVYKTLDWAVHNSHMADEVFDMLQDVQDGKDKTERWPFTKRYGKWLTPLKTAYKKKSQDGKDAGTWLHEAVELFYNSNRKTEPIFAPFTMEANLWKSFNEFDNYFKPKVSDTEFFVYSKNFGYSGQGDMKGELYGKKVIGDWKTTNRSEWNKDGIDVDYFYQLGGLSQAEFERTGEWPDDIFIANFDKEGGEPIVIWGSDFGMSPMDAAKCYIGIHNAYHTLLTWEWKFGKRV